MRSVTYGAANQRFGGCGSVLNEPGEMMPSRVTFVQDETRVDETVALLKSFYKGEKSNVPWPQAAGVTKRRGTACRCGLPVGERCLLMIHVSVVFILCV